MESGKRGMLKAGEKKKYYYFVMDLIIKKKKHNEKSLNKWGFLDLMCHVLKKKL